MPRAARAVVSLLKGGRGGTAPTWLRRRRSSDVRVENERVGETHISCILAPWGSRVDKEILGQISSLIRVLTTSKAPCAKKRPHQCTHCMLVAQTTLKPAIYALEVSLKIEQHFVFSSTANLLL